MVFLPYLKHGPKLMNCLIKVLVFRFSKWQLINEVIVEFFRQVFCFFFDTLQVWFAWSFISLVLERVVFDELHDTSFPKFGKKNIRDLKKLCVLVILL